MKILKLFQIIVVFLILTASYAQFGPQRLIDGAALSTTMIRSGDLDGDGDLDVVSSLYNEIVWYENLDGFGNFGPPVVLSSGLQQVFSVHIADLDGDNDLDIISTSFDQGMVFWKENLDGLGDFSTTHLISSDVLGVDDVIAADLDGDNDLDVIVNISNFKELAWFENLDGQGNYGLKQTVSTTATNGRSVFTGDIDGDGDNDLVSSSSGSITVAWFENTDGNGNFGPEIVIAGSAPGVEEIYGADLDADGDIDIISATFSEDKISWHENLDGLGNFGPQEIITIDAGHPRSVYTIDLDNDGDNDVLSAGSDFTVGKIAWYENMDGLGTFGAIQIIESDTDGSRSVYASDLDGDGDNDVLGTLRIDDKNTWYENLTILGVEDSKVESISLYPNPVQNTLNVESRGNETIEVLQIYDALGRLVLEKQGLIDEVDVSNLSSGLFVVKIKTENGISTQKLIKE